MAPKADINAIFLFHVFIHIMAYVLPFLVSWKIVTLISFVLYLQLIFVGKCVLTIAQNGKDTKTSYLYPYYVRMGFKPNNELMLVYGNYIEPAVFVLIAVLWQMTLGFSPLVPLLS